jgi:SWI/SNF-related matrix-associated actin-dependent regulator 1 of chromatin subfamily A
MRRDALRGQGHNERAAVITIVNRRLIRQGVGRCSGSAGERTAYDLSCQASHVRSDREQQKELLGQRTSRCQHAECGERLGSTTRTSNRRPVSLRETPRWTSRPGQVLGTMRDRTDSFRSVRKHLRKGTAMNPSRPIFAQADQLDAQAAAFAQLLGLAPADLDGAYRQAVSLGDGLFPHQIEGVAFLLGRRRAILADDMGLGKTRQAIVSLRHAAPGGPFLVVCPASVKRNWAREIEQAIPGASVRVVDGSAGAPVPQSEWTILNYDILSKHVDALGRVPWAGLVFDEAHYLKNHTSARSKLARQIAEKAAVTAKREPALYLLTGTPLTNRPRDLFVLLQLAGHPLGRSFLSFAKRYCAAEKTDYGWKTDGASNLEELTVQLHGVMLRRSKDQVLALPPKLRAWLPVDVPAGTGARELRDVVDLLVGRRHPVGAATVQDDGRARTHLLALLTKARQKLAGAKVGATSDFVSGAIDQGEKVIVFSCFDEPLQQLAKDFGDRAVLLTGRTPAHKRQALVDRFQEDGAIRVFLANIVAGGVGLNLTAASQVVFNDLDWVPANHWQAEDRAYRIGQTRTVNVTYMVGTGTVDDFVQTVLEAKAALVGAVVDGGALAGALPGSVLDELERAVRGISPGLADTPARVVDEELIGRLLREASDDLRAHEPRSGEAATSRRPEDIDALRRALEALARVLSGPSVARYRIASTSQSSVVYLITAEGSDVTCSCPGFEYRGQCRHARDVKTALASGAAVPAVYALESTV